MIGSVRPKLAVISATLAIAVSGAWAAAANTPPIATTAYIAGGPIEGPNRWCATVPNAIPSIAPMNSEGANTPPEPPIERVRLDARTLPSIRMTMNHSAYWPASALPITG